MLTSMLLASFMNWGAPLALPLARALLMAEAAMDWRGPARLPGLGLAMDARVAARDWRAPRETATDWRPPPADLGTMDMRGPPWAWATDWRLEPERFEMAMDVRLRTDARVGEVVAAPVALARPGEVARPPPLEGRTTCWSVDSRL